MVAEKLRTEPDRAGFAVVNFVDRDWLLIDVTGVKELHLETTRLAKPKSLFAPKGDDAVGVISELLERSRQRYLAGPPRGLRDFPGLPHDIRENLVVRRCGCRSDERGAVEKKVLPETTTPPSAVGVVRKPPPRESPARPSFARGVRSFLPAARVNGHRMRW